MRDGRKYVHRNIPRMFARRVKEPAAVNFAYAMHEPMLSENQVAVADSLQPPVS